MEQTTLQGPKITICRVRSIKAEKELTFKRRLVKIVRRYPQLYDPNHKHFANLLAKNVVWQKISKRLRVKVELCQNIWADLRYDYGRYARRLRKFFRSGNKNLTRRPIMSLETEMLFLWPLIPDKSRLPLPYEDDESDSEDDDVVLLDAETEIIELLDDEIVPNTTEPTNNNVSPPNDTEDDVIFVENADTDVNHGNPSAETVARPKKIRKKYTITLEGRNLVYAIAQNPVLFNTNHHQYSDIKMKGDIWNMIAQRLNDKATKLMKYWIFLQTRYEWDLMHSLDELAKNNPQKHHATQLEMLLEFIKPFVLSNRNTIYKQSYYIKKGWEEPIESFKDLFVLINEIKKRPHIVNLTEALLLTEPKHDLYFERWNEIAVATGFTACQCEVTWLILRKFFMELSSMRLGGYQLTDKWYFEPMVSEIFYLAKFLRRKRTGYTDITYPLPTTPPKQAKLSSPATSKKPFKTIASKPQVMTIPLHNHSLSVADKPTASKHQTVPRKKAAEKASTKEIKNNSLTKPLVTSAKNASLTKNVATNSKTPTQPNAAAAAAATTSAPAVAPAPTDPLPKVLGRLTVLKPVKTYTSASKANSSNSKPVIIKPVTTKSPARRKSTKNTTDAAAAKWISPAPLQTLLSATAKPMTIVHSEIHSTTPAETQSPQVPKTSMPASSAAPPARPAAPLRVPDTSVLKTNEVIIELLTTTNGNEIHACGPALPQNFSLDEHQIAELIREVLYIPWLHNNGNSHFSDYYWAKLSQIFNLPQRLMQSIWKFISRHIIYFRHIGLIELNQVYKSSIFRWPISYEFFRKFHALTLKRGWNDHVHDIADFFKFVKKFPCLYAHMSNHWVFNDYSDSEKFFAWHCLRTTYPRIPNVCEVWDTFTKSFWHYLSHLEDGYEDRWPHYWWRAFANLKFLIEVRYQPSDPFFFIARNKINEEIGRCFALDSPVPPNNKKTANPIPMVVLPEAYNMDSELSSIAEVPKQKTTGPYLPVRHKINGRLYQLCAAVRRYPDIYRNSPPAAKEKAWADVAKEMESSVEACRMAFKKAIKQFHIYRTRDPTFSCTLNTKYYQPLNEIYRVVKTRQKLSIKTPSELNNDVINGSEAQRKMFPQNYIAEIKMDNCKASLVMKNISFAVGNLSIETQTLLVPKLKAIFGNYINSTK